MADAIDITKVRELLDIAERLRDTPGLIEIKSYVWELLLEDEKAAKKANEETRKKKAEEEAKKKAEEDAKAKSAEPKQEIPIYPKTSGVQSPSSSQTDYTETRRF